MGGSHHFCAYNLQQRACECKCWTPSTGPDMSDKGEENCGGAHQRPCKFKFKDNQGCGPDDTLAKGGDADQEHAIGKHPGHNGTHHANKCWSCTRGDVKC